MTQASKQASNEANQSSNQPTSKKKSMKVEVEKKTIIWSNEVVNMMKIYACIKMA